MLKLVIVASHASLLIIFLVLLFFCWYISVWWTTVRHTLQSLVGSGTSNPVSRNCICCSFLSSIVFATKESSATIRLCFKNFLTSFPGRYNYCMIVCPNAEAHCMSLKIEFWNSLSDHLFFKFSILFHQL
jgi:hypothetical protein